MCIHGGTDENVAATDPCLISPCQNNGTCVAGSGNFTCSCLPGTTGTLCETSQSAPLRFIYLIDTSVNTVVVVIVVLTL